MTHKFSHLSKTVFKFFNTSNITAKRIFYVLIACSFVVVSAACNNVKKDNDLNFSSAAGFDTVSEIKAPDSRKTPKKQLQVGKLKKIVPNL